MEKHDVIRIYSYLDNHLGQEEMGYIDWLIDSKEIWENKYIELHHEYLKMATLADAFKAEIDQLREQLSIAEDDYYGGWDG